MNARGEKVNLFSEVLVLNEGGHLDVIRVGRRVVELEKRGVVELLQSESSLKTYSVQTTNDQIIYSFANTRN